VIGNLNQLPAGKKLPATYEGKEPLHVMRAIVEEGAAEVKYKVLCTDGKKIDLPASALEDVATPPEA
jgi:hypothetical protein